MTTISPADFFSSIWPSKLLTHETLECRLKDRKTGRVFSKFYTSIEEFLEASTQYRKTYDVYFGIATRFRGGSKKRDCYRVRVVWVDFDKKSIDYCLSLKPKPDLVVDSGGGCHAYWILERPILVRDSSLKIEAVNRGLAKRFKGDLMAIDASRILRVPGTVNHKYEPHRVVRSYAL